MKFLDKKICEEFKESFNNLDRHIHSKVYPGMKVTYPYGKFKGRRCRVSSVDFNLNGDGTFKIYLFLDIYRIDGKIGFIDNWASKVHYGVNIEDIKEFK